MERIFETLYENVSEECFEDIVSMVEELLNEDIVSAVKDYVDDNPKYKAVKRDNRTTFELTTPEDKKKAATRKEELLKKAKNIQDNSDNAKHVSPISLVKGNGDIVRKDSQVDAIKKRAEERVSELKKAGALDDDFGSSPSATVSVKGKEGVYIPDPVNPKHQSKNEKGDIATRVRSQRGEIKTEVKGTSKDGKHGAFVGFSGLQGLKQPKSEYQAVEGSKERHKKKITNSRSK